MFCKFDNLFLHKTSPFIICAESASCRNGLTNYPNSPIVMFSDTIKSGRWGYRHIIHVSKLDYSDTYRTEQGVYVTNQERTILDMIKYDAEDGFICDAIENYSYSVGTDRLREYFAKKNETSLLEDYIVEFELKV